MFRFNLLAFAFLAASAAAMPTCLSPQQVTEGPKTVFVAGDNWQEETPVDDDTQTEVWYSLTIRKLCDVVVAMNTCTTNSPPVSITVYAAAGLDCNNLPGSPVAEGVGECEAIISGDQGAIATFSHDEEEQTIYLIRVQSTAGPFDFPGVMEINIQGALAGTCGDPHFRRWNHQVRDSFHGECDMVLFHQDEVDGEDVDVHVRTTIRDSFSYIEAVAVKYGEDNVEFQHDALYINGAKVEDEDSAITFGDNNQIVKVDDKKRRFEVSIKNKVAVEVFSTKKFMGANVKGHGDAMVGSAGMLGDYTTGDMVGRDGRKMEDFQDYGFEWQVSPEDPQIFMLAREPQLPFERCRMPSMSAESRRRKLRGQDRKLYEQALTACTENHIPENVQTCVDDVMFTGELDLAYDM